MVHNRFQCPVAVHLILIENDQVLLLRRQNTGFADGMYCFPAGCIEGKESVTHAMIREAWEEAGIKLKPEWLRVTTTLHRAESADNWESIVFFFMTSHYEGVIENREPDKCDDLRFFPLKNLPKNTIPYVKKGLELSLKGISFGEFGWDSRKETYEI